MKIRIMTQSRGSDLHLVVETFIHNLENTESWIQVSEHSYRLPSRPAPREVQAELDGATAAHASQLVQFREGAEGLQRAAEEQTKEAREVTSKISKIRIMSPFRPSNLGLLGAPLQPHVDVTPHLRFKPYN